MLENDTRPTAATFLFADIAGFTALTEAHGDEEAAKLVADFSVPWSPSSPRMARARIGDALMPRIPEPERAVTLGLRIANDVMSGHGAPAVRVGMHHGTAIERDSDYIGGAVNLAPASLLPRLEAKSYSPPRLRRWLPSSKPSSTNLAAAKRSATFVSRLSS